MGWNKGYEIFEHTVINLYDDGILTRELLEKIAEPYMATDCDSGGSQELIAKDGKNFEQVICAIMKPIEYQDVVDNPKYYEGENECWESNERAYELFKSIWNGVWGIW